MINLTDYKEILHELQKRKHDLKIMSGKFWGGFLWILKTYLMSWRSPDIRILPRLRILYMYAADTYKISSESGVRAWSKAIPEAGSPFCPHLCRGTLCGKSIGDPEPKKRAGPGDERHRKEQLRLFKDCLSDHARHLHASLYPADFQFLISQRAPGNPGVAFLFTGRNAAERRG